MESNVKKIAYAIASSRHVVDYSTKLERDYLVRACVKIAELIVSESEVFAPTIARLLTEKADIQFLLHHVLRDPYYAQRQIQSLSDWLYFVVGALDVEPEAIVDVMAEEKTLVVIEKRKPDGESLGASEQATVGPVVDPVDPSADQSQSNDPQGQSGQEVPQGHGETQEQIAPQEIGLSISLLDLPDTLKELLISNNLDTIEKVKKYDEVQGLSNIPDIKPATRRRVLESIRKIAV